MSETNVQSTNESTPSTNEAVEAEADVNDNSSIDNSHDDDHGNMTGKEAMELVKQAEASGKSVADFMAERKKNKKAEAKKPEAKPADKKLETAPTKYKVKANGEEKEVSLEELTKAYSLAEGARKTLQEGVAARNQALEAVKLLKNKETLWDTLKKLGHDPYDLAETLLVERAERETLTPEELEVKEKLKRLEAYEEMERVSKKAKEDKEIAEMSAQYAQDFEKDFTEALKKVAMPKSRALIGRMAKKIRDAAKLGTHLSPEKAAERVKKEFLQEMQDVYGNSDDDALYELVGDKNAERILKKRGQQVVSNNIYNSSSNNQPKTKKQKDSGYSWNDWKQEKYKK